MKHIKPLIVALLVCAITAIVGGVFVENGLLRAVVTGAGVVIAVFVYQRMSRKPDK